ncbi:homeobox protein cut-like 1, partial [Argonauta hians]
MVKQEPLVAGLVGIGISGLGSIIGPSPSPTNHPSNNNNNNSNSSSSNSNSSNNSNNSNNSSGVGNKNQTLDTGGVAKTIREVLSMHNIGQRLFAKEVLGLSQGTVSELLSKPKSWDKLTEKGRESYRKMHAWSADESNIMALKAISPKKTGSQSLISSSQREDSATEERINQILSAAQHAMQMKSAEHVKPFSAIAPLSSQQRSPSVAHDLTTNLSHQLQVSPSAPLSAGYPKEAGHSKNTSSSSSSSSSSSLSSKGSHAAAATNGPTSGRAGRSPSPSSNAAVSVNSSSRSRSESGTPTERKHHSSGSSSSKNVSAQNSSASSKERELAAKELVARIYREELTKLAQAAESAGNVAASTMYQQELARVAQNMHRSATPLHQQQQQDGGGGVTTGGGGPGSNGASGFAPHHLHHHHQHQQEKLNIKTEPPDSCCSSSEDGGGGGGAGSQNNNNNNNGPIDLSKPHTPTTDSGGFATDGSSGGGGSSSARHSGSAFCLVRPRLNGQDSYEPASATQQQQQQQASARFSPYLPSDCLSPLQRMQNIANSLTTRSHVGTPSTKPLKAVLPPITQEQFDKYSNIDTDVLVKQVKETLSQYSISQRLFGENVLGLSQGSVSDLLARPKPWHMLTQKGREPFIRMQIFLEDGEAIPKLVASQYRIPPDKLMRSNSQSQESSSSARRRRSSIDDRCFDAPTAPKRPRIFFTEEQKEILRQAYAQDPYPNQNTIEVLASELGVGVKTVINWFHNHRMRAKQQQHPSNNSSSDGSGGGTGGSSAFGLGGGSSLVKSEPPNEDSFSNHSEGSIVSNNDATSSATPPERMLGGVGVGAALDG